MKTHSTLLGLVVALLLECTSIAHANDVQPAFRVLVLAEKGDIHEPFVDAAVYWLKGFSKEQNFEFDLYESPKGFDKELLSKYDVFLQLNYPPYRWSDEEKRAFEDYIEQGRGGWVGMHHAALLGEFDGFEMWNWFSEFLGGIRFKSYIAKRVTGTVHVEQADHPCFSGLPAEFKVDEEEWYTFNQSPCKQSAVLATVDEDSYQPSSDIKMGDHPVVWSNDKVKARNVYFLMGHHPTIMENEHFKRLLSNSILWAAETGKGQ
ncbi:ThuA domain-containing protein [Rhodopirellula sp. MGV]|uniref:ThuA domain-containing protein n=1 Tax=Rhodopirellula sp. MGV TaxID=2023130 RepID=UPI000B967686|nr:ThuA domain-containing protein [Rhodopirellula sp. MGV]OYP38854.1 glycosyl hydrolase [Rhodopirellula sp. MGV]PNY37663.1 ThuA domain-containing protein [Rhodopirellula baltica]